jgi:hypothetical protein
MLQKSRHWGFASLGPPATLEFFNGLLGQVRRQSTAGSGPGHRFPQRGVGVLRVAAGDQEEPQTQKQVPSADRSTATSF